MPDLTLDQILSSTGSTQQFILFKPYLTGVSILNWGGNFISLWDIDGNPGSGSIPTTASLGGQNYDTDSAGAIKILWPESKNIYLSSFSMVGLDDTIIYDRLWACSFTSNGTFQNVSPQPIIPTRYNDYSGLELWLEISKTQTVFPLNSVAVEVIYTNERNESGRIATLNTPSQSNKGNAIFPLILQNGDFGVKTISSCKVSISGLKINVLILKRIFDHSRNGIYCNNTSYDLFKTGLPQIKSGSCLSCIHVLKNGLTSTFVGNYLGQISFLEF
jgi:hypothetical protein